LEHTEGAVLLPCLLPGSELAEASDLADEDATAILADVIGRMRPRSPPSAAARVESWRDGFDRYVASGDTAIPSALVDRAHRMYVGLCESQRERLLLHGDLHHHNVLLDEKRGWVAIDPKGVVGELAYEVGAALRNPWLRPQIFARPDVIKQRVDCFARVLKLDTARILAWAFAQAVLSAIWEVEDTGVLDGGTGCIALARAIGPMLET
jgi:streptomycin 6-kinase